MRRVLLLAALVLAGCGGSSPSVPTIQPARSFEIAGFEPSAPVPAGKPVKISFTIQQPDGSTLTAFKRGPGPHTGVHLIYVRKDLATIIHHHPPLPGTGKIVDLVTFPAPGPYRLVIDVYPASCTTVGPCNYQLTQNITVAGSYRPQPLPAPVDAQTVDGYRFTLTGLQGLTALEPDLVHVTVTAPGGKPAVFTPYYGALAHAIFFRQGSLDYFHTHVCSPGAVGCTSFLAGKQVTGRSSTPGKLTVGVLVPVPGTWRLFLQAHTDGKLLTAPFTLHVG
jgi:hypothetical protein